MNNSTTEIGKGLVRKALDAYFAPKDFEKDGKFYEAFGIRKFSEYCPNMGSRFSISPSLIKGNRISGCKTRISLSKALELSHWAIFLGASYVIAEKFAEGKYFESAMGAAVNALVNFYPIMCQRYTRNRAQRIVNRAERRNQEAQDE